MSLHIKVVLRVAGIVMMVVGLSMLPAFFVSVFLSDEVRIRVAFLATMFSVTFIGYILRTLFADQRADLKLRDGFLLVALCWITASVTGAIPYLASGVLTDPFDAFFESVSGFSTTGASVIDDVEALPRGILFWRCFTQWIGGIGILVFAIGLMPSLGISGQNVMSPDTPNLSLGKITTKMSDAVRTLYMTYLVFTISEFLMLLLAGMNVYDALLQTFSCVGTGGFTTHNEGIAWFGSPLIYTILMVFMLLCGVNFNLYHLALRHGIRRIIKDLEFRFYFITFLVVAAAIYFALVLTGADRTMWPALDALFQTISFLSTTGYTTADYMAWPCFCQMLLLLLMFIGGCSSSTSGGVKVIRILVIFKYIAHGAHTRLHPNSVEPITINDSPAPANTVSGVTYHIFLYIVLLFAGAFLVSLENTSLEDSFGAVITCMGNIGPAFGHLGASGTFSGLHWFSKLTLAAEMLAGRLELYTLFILFTPRFWNPNS